MNKKKVIELIGNVEKYLLAYEKSGKNADIAMAFQQLHEAQDEVQKPEWISVEDELPPYEEVVWVTSNEDTEEIYFSHRTERSEVIVDKHQFATYKGSEPITHWRKIDKLEVEYGNR